MKLLNDERYQLNLEWCGYAKQRYVLRFCGEWLGSYETKKEGMLQAIFHDDERNYKLL